MNRTLDSIVNLVFSILTHRNRFLFPLKFNEIWSNITCKWDSVWLRIKSKIVITIKLNLKGKCILFLLEIKNWRFISIKLYTNYLEQNSNSIVKYLVELKYLCTEIYILLSFNLKRVWLFWKLLYDNEINETPYNLHLEGYCQYDHITFNFKRGRNIFLRVQKNFLN